MKARHLTLTLLLAGFGALSQPIITQQPASQTVSAGVNATFTVAVSGTNAVTYQWQFNGTNLQPIITTVAGNGTSTPLRYSGDGGDGTNAQLNLPAGVAVDTFGNVYIADTSNHRIRKLDTNGIITTVAGNGNFAYSGDGGPATSASLKSPSGVAFDSSGNLFIADKANNVIRKVNPSGIITTVVFSSQITSPTGVAVDGAGNLFIPTGSVIRKVNPSGQLTTVAGTSSGGYTGDGGFATNATFNTISGVAVDTSGNLFIADKNNNAIRKVNTNGIITTIVSIAGGLSAPLGIVVDSTGNLFIPSGNVIRKVATNGLITTVAGNGAGGYSGDGGPATSASLFAPSCVAVDTSGNLFIADTSNYSIRKVDTNGIISTVAGVAGSFGDGGSATDAILSNPQGVAVDAAGNLFIADTSTYRIRKVDTNAIITTVAGSGVGGYSGDGGFATNANLFYPLGVAVDAAGNLFIADQNSQRIRKVDTNGIITTVAGNGSNSYNGDGGFATNASLYNPSGVTVDTSGNLFIADQSNHRIRKVDNNGIISTVAGKVTSGGSGDGGFATNANLFYPLGVAVDAAGNLFIADRFNQRIRKVDNNGIIITVAGNGTIGYSGDDGFATSARLQYPSGVTVDAAGNLFIADQSNQRIRKVVAQDSSFTLNNVNSNNAGNYQVIISSAQGSVTSSIASLTVTLPAAIASQPKNQTVLLSSNATFSASVVGLSPMSYQWYFSNPALQTTAGAIAQTAYGFFYAAVVTNNGSGYTTVPNVQFIGGGGSGAVGTAVVSNGLVIAINVTNAAPGYASAPLVQIDPPNGLLIGQTNSSLNLNNVSSNQFGNYYVVASNGYGSVTSAPAMLILAQIPSITQQPQSQTVNVGNNALFFVTATGTPAPSYQWRMSAIQYSNAIAVPVVMNGFMLAATLTSGGSGYLENPAVQVIGGSGSGASGTAVVSNGVVTAIIINNAGSGYVLPPVIQIDPPVALNLANQTNSVLNLITVNSNNIRNYFVVVANNFGSVTSSLASLTISGVISNIQPITPSSLTFAAVGGGFQLQFVGTPNHPYILLTATNLSSPINWQSVLTNSTDPSGYWNMTVSNIPYAPARFYRTVAQ